MTYEQLKEKYYNDEFKYLSDSIKERLGKALDIWFGTTPFDEVAEITSINPWDYPEAIDIEDNSKETDRDEALELAKCEWNAKTLEEKFDKFIDLVDNGETLNGFVKQVTSL